MLFIGEKDDEMAKKKVKDLLVDALLTNEAHHKQYYLVLILEALGFNLREIREELEIGGYSFEDGIAP